MDNHNYSTSPFAIPAAELGSAKTGMHTEAANKEWT
jgi:hypothetical protein